MLVSTNTENLPEPSIAAYALSEALEKIICQRIADSGPIPFDQFMRLALYEPAYGYYMAGLPKFGVHGDFVTAPEVSDLFSYALAEQCADVLREIPGGSILEVGAGRGLMAADLLIWLAHRESLPECYYILELSADLREQQRANLHKKVPELVSRVVWLESLDGLALQGIVLANEVLDAMPIKRFQVTETGICEMCVDWDAETDRFKWISAAAPNNLKHVVETVQNALGSSLPTGFMSEINLNLLPWLRSIESCLRYGVLIAIDYGYSQREYYRADRKQGTMMCHYRHYGHSDPLRWPGLQDITAHVDFTAVAEAAAESGLNLLGFSQQAEFLLACGLDSIVMELAQAEVPAQQLARTQQLKILLLPTEMGGRFQVMGLAKGYNRPLLGFNDAGDLRHRL